MDLKHVGFSENAKFDVNIVPFSTGQIQLVL